MWGGPPPHHMQHHVQPPSVGPPPSVIATPGAKLGQGPVPGSYMININTLKFSLEIREKILTNYLVV